MLLHPTSSWCSWTNAIGLVTPNRARVLKNLITSDWEIVERKNIDSEKMKTYKSVGIASNRVRYAQVEPSNRRIACYDVSNAHMKDWDYFAAIREEIARRWKRGDDGRSLDPRHIQEGL